jgi:hypothetical protein
LNEPKTLTDDELLAGLERSLHAQERDPLDQDRPHVIERIRAEILRRLRERAKLLKVVREFKSATSIQEVWSESTKAIAES